MLLHFEFVLLHFELQPCLALFYICEHCAMQGINAVC